MHSNSEKCSINNRPLILIVDNDRDNLLFASYVIESLGMNSVVTDQGEECLRLVNDLSPDLILLDIVMPKMNGLEITCQIKQNPSIATIPIIAVTGLTKPEDINQMTVAGCDDYLRKPYLIEELESKIFGCLKLSLA
ncbi:MAG: hypothetical protein Tsb0014_18110 [Pleurocapsa sp.]